MHLSICVSVNRSAGERLHRQFSIDFNQIFQAARKCLTEQESRLAHYFAQFWDMGLHLGYLATSGAKSDIKFLLGDPDFLQR